MLLLLAAVFDIFRVELLRLVNTLELADETVFVFTKTMLPARLEADKNFWSFLFEFTDVFCYWLSAPTRLVGLCLIDMEFVCLCCYYDY